MDGTIQRIRDIRETYSKSNHYVNYLLDFYDAFLKNSCFPPGHYYSPIIDIDEIKEFNDKLFIINTKDVPGVDLNEDQQVQLLKAFETYAKDLFFPADKTEGIRYFLNNDVFSYTDGIMLFCFIMHFKPKTIIEVGSGYSSALMLDTSSKYFNYDINLNFIEPFPERLYDLIGESNKTNCKIIQSKVQYVDTAFFKDLKENDILFIDGSHISKTGSDLNYLLFEVLPVLNDGVIIHFHDIFNGFEYPSEWVYEGRNWNEIYLLRAFLSYNSSFEILMFNSFMHFAHSKSFEKLSECYKNFGGSLWMRKVSKSIKMPES